MNKIITFKDKAEYDSYVDENGMDVVYSSNLVGYMTNLGQYHIVKSRFCRSNQVVTLDQYLDIVKLSFKTVSFS